MGRAGQADLGRWIHLVATTVRRTMSERLAAEAWLRDKGFRPPCIGALQTIAAHQPLSQRELSEHLGLDPSDTVDVVDILETAGYVSRDRDPLDRRRHALTLTSDGKAATARLEEILGEVEAQVLEPLNASERRTLRGLLARVADHHAGNVTASEGWVPPSPR